MEYARHEAEMNAPGEDGVSLRSHLEEKRRRGLPCPELDSVPECPEELAHLYGFAIELIGRSGVGMSGFAPLSYSLIRDWSHLTGWTLEPCEVDAVIRLDSVMRDSAKKDEAPKLTEDAQVEIAPWPQKKKDGNG